MPAIDDNGFCVRESNAIVKYLANKYQVDDHWYPKARKIIGFVEFFLVF